MLIAAPAEASLDALAKFPLLVRSVADADEVQIDFEGVSFTSPAWLAVVGGALRELRRSSPAARRKVLNHKNLRYAAHVGFFQYFGVNYGLAPAVAAGSETYVPLIERFTAAVREEAALRMTPVGEVIHDEAERLAGVLTRHTPGDLQDTLAYSIREIVRNVVEHSGADSYTLAAQWWPGTGQVEVVVTDQGCGVAASLQENPHLTIQTDEEALRQAVLPGISAKAWRRSKSYDDWANSGYGLFMTQRLCALGGSFGLMSGSRALHFEGAQTRVLETDWPGVVVVLRLDTNRLAVLSERLADFRREGAELERQLKSAARTGPSRASQTLKPSAREA